MKTYVLMSKLTPQGPSIVEVVSRVKSGPKTRRAWIEEVRKQCPEVKFLASYALLGSWDFMDIYEAPDSETAAKVSMICSSMGSFAVESWTAISEQRMEKLAEEVQKKME